MNQLANPAAITFASLVGKWSIDRQIFDKLSNLTAKVYGVAVISKQSQNELLYNEEIQVKWENSLETTSGSKLYKYVLSDSSKLEQYNSIYDREGNQGFEKMYDLNFYCDEASNILFANGEFQCGPDLYKAEYEFDSLKKFQLIYEVKGKSKNFVTKTIFRKSHFVVE
uniref:DUF6314 domain-containing protein n=1 Tax=Panagrolaimus davidi TaxID=227884 RepID=A0A914P7E1_9BILA